MTTRAKASLGRILEALGGTLLTASYGTPEENRVVEGIIIHDPLDEFVVPSGSLVLGVGLSHIEEIVQLLNELGAHGAVGLILRSDGSTNDRVLDAATQSGVAVFGLTRGASWDQLAAMLRSMLAEGDIGLSDHESLGGVPSGDLFALANAISALVDAPVTIEDRDSRVMAFSGDQNQADPARVETVLGRHVPDRYARALTDLGVFRDLYHSDAPVHIGPVETEYGDASLPRVAVAVRAGDEILGSIWAVTAKPMTQERLDALHDSAKIVALQLLRIRAGADVEHRVRADLVSTALEGGVGAREALYRLGLADEPLLVMALAIAEKGNLSPGAAAAYQGEAQRLGTALGMHLAAVFPRSASAVVGRIVYALLPASEGEPSIEDRAERIGRDFLDRLGTRVDAMLGIGMVASDSSEIAYARACADRALRVLRQAPSAGRVARLSEVHTEALLLELKDAMTVRGDRASGPVARLLAHEGGTPGTLVCTIRAWLEAFGDVAVASKEMAVHPNTFRYRLRKAVEICGLDLNDPQARFAAMLQLRMLIPNREVHE